MKNLSNKVGDMDFDGLVTGINPAVIVGGGSLKRLAAEATIKRGTILAKGADGNLIVLGSDVDSTKTFSATGDGTKALFSLVSAGVYPTSVDEVKVDGTATTAYVFDAKAGTIEFETAPANTKTIAVKFTVGGGNAYAILCDDTVVGTSAEVNAPIYIAGCFDLNKCTVAEDYTVSDDDKYTLRALGIIFKSAED